MRILLSTEMAQPPVFHPSERLSPEENAKFQALMTQLFKDKVLKSAEAGALDFLSKKMEKAPFSLRPTSTAHQFEFVVQENPVAQPELKQTHLHDLVKTGSPEQVKVLFSAYSQWVNVRNLRGQTPLAVAIETQTQENNRLEVVKLLCEAGADVTLADKDNWTPLYRASRGERLDIFEYIVARGANEDVNQANLDARSTPLMRMVDSGSIPGVQRLLDLKADPNAVNDLGSCVYYASKNGNVDLVILLHQAKADLNRVGDALGMTPLGVAMNSRHQAVVEYLKTHGALTAPSERDQTELHQLALKGSLEAIIESANKGEKDKFGRSVAHYCAAIGRVEALQKMDSKFADEPDVIYRRSPLHYAIIHGQEGAVKYLISAGCSLYQEDKAKHFPLTWAAQFGREGIARLLVDEANKRDEKQKMLEQVDNYEWTVLHKAAKHGHLDLVKFFVLECGMDPEKKTGRGMTPMKLAEEIKAAAVVQFLQSAPSKK